VNENVLRNCFLVFHEFALFYKTGKPAKYLNHKARASTSEFVESGEKPSFYLQKATPWTQPITSSRYGFEQTPVVRSLFWSSPRLIWRKDPLPSTFPVQVHFGKYVSFL